MIKEMCIHCAIQSAELESKLFKNMTVQYFVVCTHSLLKSVTKQLDTAHDHFNDFELGIIHLPDA